MRSEDRDARAEARDERDGLIDVDAAADRVGARRDREGAASDRKQAEDDRHAAEADRALSAVQRASLLYDELTGTYTRDAGLMELEREVVRARRTGEAFTLAFIDVDGLKRVNDSGGHLEGDRLLTRVAEAIQAVVRDYDVVVRYGGDEFICGLLGVGLDDAVPRFARMTTNLKQTGDSATVGLAELDPDEDIAHLIDRADMLMYDSKVKARSRDSGQ